MERSASRRLQETTVLINSILNKNTLEKADWVVLLKVEISKCKQIAEIKELLSVSKDDAKLLMVERKNFHISLSKTRNLEKYLAEEKDEDDMVEEQTEFFIGHQFEFEKQKNLLYRLNQAGTKVRVLINGEPLMTPVKPYLVKLCESFDIKTERPKANRKGEIVKRTNKELADDIVKKTKSSLKMQLDDIKKET